MIRPLTSRQQQIVDGICRGKEYGEIAVELGLSRHTVDGHVRTIMNFLPNPDQLEPYLCIFLWARHREWLLDRLERDVKQHTTSSEAADRATYVRLCEACGLYENFDPCRRTQWLGR